MIGSQMTLGSIYEQGMGVEKDEVEARKWYQMSEKAGETATS